MNRYRLLAAAPTLARSLRAACIRTTPKPLNYLDIGARGGLPRRWRVLERLGSIRPIYVEADADEAAKLQAKGRILCAALGSEDGAVVNLNITRDAYFSSVLEPMIDSWPSEYRDGCEVVDRRLMKVSRLDTIWPASYGDPHFIKVDTQGYDLEVLKGFGDLLNKVLCAEVEVRIAQQYTDQPTASDVVAFMRSVAFDLVGLRSNGLQAGRSMMVFNAFFVATGSKDTDAVRLWKAVNDLGSADRIRTLGR